MRVAFNSFPTSLVDELSRLADQQNRLQNQAATGQRITSPEDDPVAMQRVLDLQAEGQALGQYQHNIDSLKQRATAVFTALQGLKKISDRAGEIATLADGTKSPQELSTYATEVNQLIQQAVQWMNSQDRGDYVFGGTQSDQPPFAATTAPGGQVTSVAYRGNSSAPAVNIGPNDPITVQVPGVNNSGSGPTGLIADSRNGADFFNHLISLRNHLAAGDTGGIAATDRSALGHDENNFILQLSDNGAVQSRLENAAAAATSRTTALRGMISNETDADMAQTLVQLSATQNAYRAALQTGATILNRSLMDYLT